MSIKPYFMKLRIIKYITYVLLQAERISIIEEQNERLTETVVEAMDLVSNYKKALVQMRQQIEFMVQMQTMASKWEKWDGTYNERKTDELMEEDEEFDQYELIRKKTTIH